MRAGDEVEVVVGNETLNEFSWVFCIKVTVKDPCMELWCNRAASRRRSCMTRMTQTLEGTPCGRGMVLIMNSVC